MENRFCECCGNELVVDTLGGFSAKTGKRKYFTRCPNGCDISSYRCKYYKGDHNYNFFGRCKCGAKYPDNSNIAFGMNGKEIAREQKLFKLPKVSEFNKQMGEIV